MKIQQMKQLLKYSVDWTSYLMEQNSITIFELYCRSLWTDTAWFSPEWRCIKKHLKCPNAIKNSSSSVPAEQFSIGPAHDDINNNQQQPTAAATTTKIATHSVKSAYFLQIRKLSESVG